jgi:phage tail sheath protein FI
MPEYLSPGVYVEEISVGPKPIEGVSTSTAGFVGAAERGPEYPNLIGSWLEFQRWYGSYIDSSYLAYAVQGFFDNGGKRCFVSRVTGAAAARTAGALGNLRVVAIGRGAWGNRIMIKVTPSTAAPLDPNKFRVFVLYYRDPPATFVDPTDSALLADKNRKEPDRLEVFDNLSFQPNDSSSVVTTVNASSHLVRVSWDGAAPQRPADQGFTVLGTNGTDAAPDVNDYTGSDVAIPGLPDDLLGRGWGLKGLELVDEISLLLVPDEVQANLGPITIEVLKQCNTLKDRFALVSVANGQSSVTNLRPPDDDKYSAFYYPWIRVYDPISRSKPLIPPTGHVAGIFARTDIERGVHKAPANEVVRGALDLEFPVTTTMQDILNPRGVNCIRDFRPDRRGIRLWGARTMSSDGEWKYVNVRRLFLFLEESIDEGTQWVVFEPNDEPLWARVRRTIENFLIRVWRNGALMGTTQDEAFFVKCDRTTMTQDDIDNGRLICLIGIAPVKPAEFVIFRFFQKTADAES